MAFTPFLLMVVLAAFFLLVATEIITAGEFDDELAAIYEVESLMYAEPPQAWNGTSHAPAHSPAYSPPSSSTTRNHMRYCVPECQRRCIMLRDDYKTLRKIRPCVHVCSICCDQNKPLCVPVAETQCPFWGTVLYHGGMRQCP